MFIVYLVLAAIGLVGTWWFNLRVDYTTDSYLGGWFANAASSSAAVDLIIVAFAAIAFMIVEGRRLRLRITWVCVALTLPVAVAFAFPLFLAFRHRAVHAVRPGGVGPAAVSGAGAR